MNEQLPRLPEAVDLMQAVWRGGHEFMRPVGSYYTADQMRDYARAALAAKVPADPCLVLWKAMNQAGKVGIRTDDKLIVKFLREAGYCIAATPAPAPEAERKALRYAQAEAVMPLIGPLLDAWENADRDVLAVEPELAKRLSQINKAMEGAEADPCTYPACQTNGCREACDAPAQAQQAGCSYCQHPLFAATKCPSCGYAPAQAQQAKGDPKLLAILNAPMTLQEAYGEGWCDRKQFKNFDEAWQHSTTRYKAEAKPEAQQPLTDFTLDRMTDHLYLGGRPVAALYRVALGRMVQVACAEQWGVKLGASGEASND